MPKVAHMESKLSIESKKCIKLYSLLVQQKVLSVDPDAVMY